MAGLKLYFSVSDRQYRGSFGISLNPSLDCCDNWAVLNVEGKSYDVTNLPVGVAYSMAGKEFYDLYDLKAVMPRITAPKLRTNAKESKRMCCFSAGLNRKGQHQGSADLGHADEYVRFRQADTAD